MQENFHDTPKLLLRIEYNRPMVWFGFAIFLFFTAACVWGVIWVAEPSNFSVHASDFFVRRRTRTAIWIFRMLPEPLRVLVMLSALALFASCTAAIARLLWRNTPMADLRSDGIVSNHLFKRRFDVWKKIRLIGYYPSYDKQGRVSHSFHITLHKYGFNFWATHQLQFSHFKAKFDAQEVFDILREKRPDLLPDLFLASDRQVEPPPIVKAPAKPTAPAIEVNADGWTG
jgi:hypothetical protein